MENINIRADVKTLKLNSSRQAIFVCITEHGHSSRTGSVSDLGVGIARTQRLFTVYAHCMLSRIELFLKTLPLKPALLVSLQHCMPISNNIPLADFHSDEWSPLFILWQMISQSLVLMFPAASRTQGVFLEHFTHGTMRG